MVIDLSSRVTITSLSFKIWKIWTPAACEDKKFFQNVYDFIQDAFNCNVSFLCQISILPKVLPVKHIIAVAKTRNTANNILTSTKNGLC